MSTRKTDSQRSMNRYCRSTRNFLTSSAAVRPGGSDSQPGGSDPQVRFANLRGLQTAWMSKGFDSRPHHCRHA
eukprot:15441238-Alexandrium_andersonii.AAC.1